MPHPLLVPVIVLPGRPPLVLLPLLVLSPVLALTSLLLTITGAATTLLEPVLWVLALTKLLGLHGAVVNQVEVFILNKQHDSRLSHTLNT